METAGIEPAPPRCKRGALPSEPRPQNPGDGWTAARVVLLQLLDRPLAAVVRSELLDEALTEGAERRDQRVQLVQRVLAAPRRVDIDAERRHILTVADLQDHARLEVRRAVRALVRAVLADHRLA